MTGQVMQTIVNLEPTHSNQIERICKFLPRCFSKYSPSWLPDKASCLEQIQNSFVEGRVSRVMVDDEGNPFGWIGAIQGERTWEIHPLAVAPEAQRRGIGKLLVADIERLAEASGAVSVWAGTSDETCSTSFSKFDLYCDLGNALASVEAPDDHAINFWLKIGYSIVGVLPDEEGLGKPGIHFAKRIVPNSEVV